MTKCEQRNQFVEVFEEIQKLSIELFDNSLSSTAQDESDFSLKKLEELHKELQKLQKEKSDRVKHLLELLNTLKSLCLVLGFNFSNTVEEIHPSLHENSEETKSISNRTFEMLTDVNKNLMELKLQRMQRLQDLATSILELWNVIDTPLEEKQMLKHVTCKIAASDEEIMEPNMLSSEFLNDVELEVFRLEELKSRKMKELVPDSHLAVDVEAIESGTEAVDPACLLEKIRLQIGTVKEEEFSRTEIFEKVEMQTSASEEKGRLDEYNKDDNRYNAGRGAHLILKRAEKAPILVNKLPGMVETSASKTTAGEKEMSTQFSYDGAVENAATIQNLDNELMREVGRLQNLLVQLDQIRLQRPLIQAHIDDIIMMGLVPEPDSEIMVNFNELEQQERLLEIEILEKNIEVAVLFSRRALAQHEEEASTN